MNQRNIKKLNIFLIGIILNSITIYSQQIIEEKPMIDENIINLAVKIVDITPEEARAHYKEIPEIDAFYFAKPIRGGRAVIINSGCEYLSVVSAVNYEEHVQAFRDGKRSDWTLFWKE
jgi:hypothetical protein